MLAFAANPNPPTLVAPIAAAFPRLATVVVAAAVPIDNLPNNPIILLIPPANFPPILNIGPIAATNAANLIIFFCVSGGNAENLSANSPTLVAKSVIVGATA